MNVSLLVAQLGLQPHPEGGYYKETYRAGGTVPAEALPDRFGGTRNYSTAIYFLLEQGNFSAFHRIESDECWHFYAGQTLHVHMISPQGEYSQLRLGSDMEKGEIFQAVVPNGYWFASETAPGGLFSLVGCTVAPGFDFADFEMANAAQLITIFPQHALLIRRLCRA